MSSNPISLIPGCQFLDYRLVDVIGSATSLWRAEEIRTGSLVAIKILSRHLPGEPARRQELLKELRQTAALRHPNLVTIRDIGENGDLLYMTMELVDGEPLSRVIRRGVADRKQLFRLGYQLIGAIAYLHARGIVHGNVAGDTVLLTRNGTVKLAGFNLANLSSEDADRVHRRLLDLEAVACTAPEAIRGTALDTRSDIFSFGCVMYEALTGRVAFAGSTAEEVASAVVEGQPVSPKTIRPDVDPAAVALIGRCLFKDPARRPATAAEVRAVILKAEPALEAMPIAAADSTDDAKRVAEPRPPAHRPARTGEAHDGVIWVAELANFSELEADEPSRARKTAARMQQILGEAAHLFDGTVSDVTGKRMVAEMPDATRAYQAGRKGELDLADVLDGREPKPLIRMVLHAGALNRGGAAIEGEAVEEVADTLTTMPPGRLYMTEKFVLRSLGIVKTERAVGVPGPLYVGAAPEKALPQSVAAVPGNASDMNATIALQNPLKRLAPKDPAELTTVVQTARSNRLIIAIAAASLLLLLSVAAIWFSSHRESPAASVTVVDDDSLPTSARPHTITLSAVTTDVADPALSDRASRARAAAIEILRSAPQLRVAYAEGNGADVFGARVQRTAAGDQIIPLHPSGRQQTGEVAAFVDAASGARSLVAWICSQLRVPPPGMSPSQEALNRFADAVTAYEAKKPGAEVDRSLKAALSADPGFVPAQMFAMRVYSERGDLRRAEGSAKQVLSHDAGNVRALELMARFSAATGDAASSIGYWNLTLENDPKNVTAINALGRFALAGNDAPLFERALGRQRYAGAGNRGELHEPDLLVASGKIDAAVDKYYDLEIREPQNPALALKIGRIAVLRHSASIADIELKKLQTLDPNYSAHILQAYIAAQGGQKGRAAGELELAVKASPISGDPYTSAAEIAAMTGDARWVVSSLQKALDNSEPTAGYVLSDPLFVYLRSDSAFRGVRDSIAAEQEAIKAALQRVKL